MNEKYTYMFSEENIETKELLGEKGANLAEMTAMGLPIPQGFTVSTRACSRYYDNDENLSNDIISDIYECLKKLEETSEKNFGSIDNPLLLSIRAGARISIPGIKCSILNVGLNTEITKKLEEKNERAALDCYRVLIQMYGNMVKGIEQKDFLDVADNMIESKNIKSLSELQPSDLRQLILDYKEIYKNATGEEFPEDPNVQLKEAIGAMFKLWNNAKTIIYRKENNIPNEWGIAANIQEMVFGNMNEHSGVGIAFSRNPETGENNIYGKFLINTQTLENKETNFIEQLKNIDNYVYGEILKDMKLLENHYKDMQNVEFIVEDEKLYLLQVRSGARTAEAALKIATDLVQEDAITEKEAILKVKPIQLEELYNKKLEDNNSQLLIQFMNWIDKYRKLKIRANIDTPEKAKIAYDCGAEGIAFCKTENLFLGDDRLDIIKKISVSNDENQKSELLNQLSEIQKQDYINIYKEINGYPIAIKLLDMKAYKIFVAKNNIMNLSYAEILKMQIITIINASIQVNEEGMNVIPQIMISQAQDEEETKYFKNLLEQTINEILKQKNVELKYEIGIIIETPRTALLMNEISKQCANYIFDTGLLTQWAFGIDDDNINNTLKKYYDEGIYGFNPFSRIDEKSIGKLMQLAIEAGKRIRPDIKLGACGEQVNDPKSVEFFDTMGLMYICCSADKIQMAKLAAAQAAIKREQYEKSKNELS